jgi:hypothetical protein
VPEPDERLAELNLAWSDPRLEAALHPLLRREPRPALDLLGATRGDADRRELYADVLGGAGQHALAELRAAAQEAAADDPDRWLLLGASLSAAAWTARGAAVIEHTSDQQIGSMTSLAAQARRALGRAAELAPADPVPWSEHLRCAQAVVDDDRELDEIFARLQRLGPDLYSANQVRLGTLTRKWYGRQEQALAFARGRARDLPPGHPLLALIASVHIEGLVDEGMRGNVIGRIWRSIRYLSNKAVRAEVDAASDRLLAGSDRFAAHPWSMAAHQVFATLYNQVPDHDRTRPHLQRGGPRPMPWPWGYFGDAAQQFTAARKAAGFNAG